MASRTFDVARMRADERSHVVGALARAFYDDPLFSYFMADPISQSKGLLSFMGAGIADPAAETWVAHTGGKVACVAVWLPPGAYPRSTRRELMSNLRGAPAFARSGRQLPGAIRLLEALKDEHHEVKEPHFYLGFLGTDPLYQRMGAATAALQPVLERCDTEGLSAYLETQREENLAYYARHAFTMIKKVEVKGVPPMWTLIRAPRPAP